MQAVVTALIQCLEQEEPPEPLEATEHDHSPRTAIEFAEGLMILPAKSEPVQTVVTFLIHCHKQEKPPASWAAPDPKEAPETAMEVPKDP